MSAFSDLLREGNTEKWSNREIARRSDGRLSRATVDTYMKDGHGIPTEEIIDAFHSVLSIPRTELRVAAGLPAGENSPYTPPAEANLLDHRQRRAVDELIRSIVATRGAAHAVDSPPGQAEPSAQESPAERQKTQFQVFAVREADPSTVTEWSAEGSSERDILDGVIHGLQIAGYETSHADTRFDLVADGFGGKVFFEVISGDHPAREERARRKLMRAAARSQNERSDRIRRYNPEFVFADPMEPRIVVVDETHLLSEEDKELEQLLAALRASVLATTSSNDHYEVVLKRAIGESRRTPGGPDPDVSPLTDSDQVSTVYPASELPTAARRGGGKSSTRAAREEQDRDAERGDR